MDNLKLWVDKTQQKELIILMTSYVFCAFYAVIIADNYVTWKVTCK